MNTFFRAAGQPLPGYRFGTPSVGRCAGIVGSGAVLAFGYLLFVPFADTTALQYAAGPCAVEADGVSQPAIARAITGRSWNGDPAACARRAAASAPRLRLAVAAVASTRSACGTVVSDMP